MLATQNINVPEERIAEFCRKWRVTEFSLFGSVLRSDFSPNSDVDVVIRLADDAPWSLFDWVAMIDELKLLFGRDVDLVEETGLRNPIRRQEIMGTRKVIYAA